MQDMARQVDKAGITPVAPSPTDEREALIGLDPLLASMDKQFQDARAHYHEIVKAFGMDDPMSIVARDMMDSTESALETRLIELRHDKAMQEAVEQALRVTDAEAERYETSILKRRELNDFYAKTSKRDAARRAEKEANEGFLMVVLLLMTLYRTIANTRRKLELASIFLGASQHDRTMKAA